MAWLPFPALRPACTPLPAAFPSGRPSPACPAPPAKTLTALCLSPPPLRRTFTPSIPRPPRCLCFGSGWGTLGRLSPAAPQPRSWRPHLTGRWAELGGLGGNPESQPPGTEDRRKEDLSGDKDHQTRMEPFRRRRGGRSMFTSSKPVPAPAHISNSGRFPGAPVSLLVWELRPLG